MALVPETPPALTARAPEVEVWIDRYVFRSGERIRTYFESEPGAYVTILRITTLGDVDDPLSEKADCSAGLPR